MANQRKSKRPNWGGRILRIWIAVLLPVAAFCGYQAHSYHKSIDNWQQLVSAAYEHLYSEKPSVFSLAERRAIFEEMVDFRDRARVSRDRYVAWAIGLGAFPGILYIALVGGAWLWYGNNGERKKVVADYHDKHDPEEVPHTRPKGTIVIVVYQVVGALMVGAGIVYNVMIRLNLAPNAALSQVQVEQIQATPMFWTLFAIVALLIRLVGSFLLFALRKAGSYLLIADAAIQLISVVIGLLIGFNALGVEGLVSSAAVISLGIAVGIAIYAWSLSRRGILN